MIHTPAKSLETPKITIPAFLLMGLGISFLGYLITKEVTLPSWVLLTGSFVVGIFLLFKGISQPAIITYVLVAYLPFSRQLAGDFGGAAFAFNFTNLLMLFIIFVWMTGRYSKDEPLWLGSSLNFPIFLFMLIGFISVFRGNYYGTGFIHYALIDYKRWITPIFLYYLALNTVKEKTMIQNVIAIMIIASTVVGLMAIYDYIDLGNVSSLDKSRIGGIADQPNMLAAFFNYYMFLPIGFLLLNLNRFTYWFLLIPFLICFRGIMVTFSRGGYAACAAALYAITFCRNKFLFLALIFLTVIVYFNPVLLPAGIRYRFGQTLTKNVSYTDSFENIEGSLEGSSQSRIEVWKGGIELIKDHPLWGVGYGLFPAMIQYYWSGEKEIDAHNSYLIIAGEMGIPALLVFLWIVLLVFRETWTLYQMSQDRFSKGLALGFLGGLVGLLVSNMFGSRLDAQEISSYFWILAALVVRLKRIEQVEQLNAAKAFPKENELCLTH